MTLTREQLVTLCERRDIGIVADAASWHPEASTLLAGVPPEAVDGLRADGRRAVQEVVENSLGLVGLVVNRHGSGRSAIKDDLFQEGVIGLVAAAWGYDPTQGRFSTYAYHHVRGAVMTAMLTNAGEHHLLTNQARDLMQVRRAELELITSGRAADPAAVAHELGRPLATITEIMGYARHSTIPLDAHDMPDRANRTQRELDKLIEPDIARYVRMLPTLERQVIEELHGINGLQRRTPEVVAQELGTSPTSVRRIADVGYTHLRGLIDRESEHQHFGLLAGGSVSGVVVPARRSVVRHEQDPVQTRPRPATAARR